MPISLPIVRYGTKKRTPPPLEDNGREVIERGRPQKLCLN
jgi:hypothetical protein